MAKNFPPDPIDITTKQRTRHERHWQQGQTRISQRKASSCSEAVVAVGNVEASGPASKLLVSPQEAAEMLSVDRSTLYPLLMSGEIPSIKIGRSRRIPVSALEQWIENELNQQLAA